MPIQTTRDKFIHELADMYDAEHRFLAAMGTMRERASDARLQTLLEDHIQQSEDQIRQLEHVFAEAGREPQREEAAGARGLVEEASKLIEEAGTNELRDAFIASAATKAKHYEMVGYADLIDDAEILELRGSVRVLTENRLQEILAARKLERLAPRLGKAAA